MVYGIDNSGPETFSVSLTSYTFQIVIIHRTCVFIVQSHHWKMWPWSQQWWPNFMLASTHITV